MTINLSDKDRDMLQGCYGEAAHLAMTIVTRMGEIYGATELLDVTQAHIDGCGLMSDSGMDFAEKLVFLGAKVCIPTTLNMVPLDLQNWKKLGVPDEFAGKATRIANAYLAMGCVPTWTCAPYQWYLTPRFGQQIAWGESNAIVYANSVLGARTNRYADYFDICAAITGRVPKTGLHITENRRGQVLLHLQDIPPELLADDSFYPVLGSYLGQVVGDRIPVIEGLPFNLSSDQFKALGAAAASSGGVGLYHIVGVTPEAPTLEEAFQGEAPEKVVLVTLEDLKRARADLSTPGTGGSLDAVVLGCPHFSYAEFLVLARLIQACPQPLHPNVRFIILTNQMSYALLGRGGLMDEIVSFGAELVLDTCVFHSPIVSSKAQTIMTNSGKCAYYAPGEMNVNVAFGSMQDCVRSAAAGRVVIMEGAWK
jgi:predicted aconitase